MHKGIIISLTLALVILFCSCSASTDSVSKSNNYDTKNSNSIKIDKSDKADDVELSPYYDKADMTYCYDRLETDDDRALYNAIIENCGSVSDTLSEDGKFYAVEPIVIQNFTPDRRQIFNVVSAVFDDNPDIFWLDSNYSYTTNSEGVFTLSMRSCFDNATLKENKNQLNAVINSVLRNLKPDMSEFERELYIHDYIVKNCKYKKNKNTTNHYTAYGCLVEQKAVCEGYNEAFELLLSYSGVYSTPVSGYDKKDGIGHVWSAVQLDGDWYHADVTWDDDKEYNMYDYFNITTAQIKNTHTISPDYADITDEELIGENDLGINYNAELPRCTETKYNYYKYTGSNLNDIDDNTLAEDLAKAAENKEHYFNIYVNPETMNFRTTYDQLFSDELYTFRYYIEEANDILGSDVLQIYNMVSEKEILNTINVELYYN